jgi:hypothetical protein
VQVRCDTVSRAIRGATHAPRIPSVKKDCKSPMNRFTPFSFVSLKRPPLLPPTSSSMERKETILCCVPQSGSRQRKPFDNKLLMHGFSREKVKIHSQSRSCSDLEIFNNSFRGTSLPKRKAPCQGFNSKGPALLLAGICRTQGHPNLASTTLVKSTKRPWPMHFWD